MIIIGGIMVCWQGMRAGDAKTHCNFTTENNSLYFQILSLTNYYLSILVHLFVKWRYYLH